MVAWRIWPTEKGSRRNLHRPKATTKAKEKASEAGLATGRPMELATSARILSPGAKERPGKVGNAMERKHPGETKKGRTLKGFGGSGTYRLESSNEPRRAG